jgi:hypothetical protein
MADSEEVPTPSASTEIELPPVPSAEAKKEPIPRAIRILPAEKSIYFNGFEMGLGQSDIVLTAKVNENPIITLNMSFSTAKTLSEKLQKAILILEKATGRSIMTIDEIKEATPKIVNLSKIEDLSKAEPHELD